MITLSEDKLAAVAGQLFDGATPAKKNVAPAAVLRNDTDQPISFNVVLKDGTVENEGSSIPPGGFAVVQVGGEINVMSDFYALYENTQDGVSSELSGHVDEAITRAEIEGVPLTRFTATAKQRVDQYLKLPTAEDGASIDFVIMKPWGENGALIPQEAYSGDVLVLNGTNNTFYYNSINGTLENFVNAETGNPIPDELDTMKTAPLADLRAAVDVGPKPGGPEEPHA